MSDISTVGESIQLGFLLFEPEGKKDNSKEREEGRSYM
jgi:hypothetical protein